MTDIDVRFLLLLIVCLFIFESDSIQLVSIRYSQDSLKVLYVIL
jgi:hypothetical protein